MPDATSFYINGAWTAPLSDARMDVIDPSTGEAFAQVALANEADVDRAVQAALLLSHIARREAGAAPPGHCHIRAPYGGDRRCGDARTRRPQGFCA